MTKPLRLENEDAFVDVLPEVGGGLTGFDVKTGGDPLPVFRRWSGQAGEEPTPRTIALNAILPWFNRISGGGFWFRGTFHRIALNDPEDPFPLHGDAWQSPWAIVAHGGDRIALRLRSRAIPPFDYEADLAYSLAGTALIVELAVTNRAAEPLPYGLALHPWFPRTPETRLQAPATGVWLEQPPEELPKSAVAEAIPTAWDFSTPKHLPDGFIDNCFAGWSGEARINWPDRGLAVDIEADPKVGYCQIYSLGADSGFFCFEQVTHPIDALNLPGAPEEKGLRVLAPGETTAISVRFTAHLL